MGEPDWSDLVAESTRTGVSIIDLLGMQAKRDVTFRFQELAALLNVEVDEEYVREQLAKYSRHEFRKLADAAERVVAAASASEVLGFGSENIVG